jgi:flavin-dependent dehydrogenase
LEKETFPRATVGESLIPQFWRFADLSGVSPKLRAESFMQKGGAAVCWGGSWRRVSFGAAGFTVPALHVERDRFDDILLCHARDSGVQVIEAAQAVDFDCCKNASTVSYRTPEGLHTINASFIIDASGQRAMTSVRREQRKFIEGFNYQAVWGYYDKSSYIGSNGKCLAFNLRYKTKPLTMVCELDGDGWLWHIVLRDKVSVGLVLSPSLFAKFKSLGPSLESRFLNFCKTHLILKKFIPDSSIVGPVCSIRDYSYQSRRLAFERVFLIGDAASFVDPISSEGVPLAMFGAYLASWAVDNCFKNKGRTDFYQQLYSLNYQKKLDLFRVISSPDEIVDLSHIPALLSGLGDTELRLILSHTKLTGRTRVHEALSDLRPDLCDFVEEFDFVNPR